MFDTDNYRKACAQTKLDANKLEEMITMTENMNPKKRLSRPMRTALIAAACVAALCVTAFAAVPAVQQFFTTYTVTFHGGDGVETAIIIPTMTLTDRDDRTILTVDGQEIDVTDAFAKDGAYSFEHEGATITVDAEGWVTMDSAAFYRKQPTITADADGRLDIQTADDDPISYSFNLYGKDAVGGDDAQDDQVDVDAAPAGEMELPHPNADEVQESYTVLPAPDGGMNIYDGQGNLVDYDPPASPAE